VIKVLVTDPDPAYAGMIQQILQESGEFQVQAASTGAQAMSLAAATPPDIVLLETSLQDFSLRDAVTALRRAQPSLPIIVVLPFGEQPLPDAARFFDVQAILTKPLYIPELGHAIKEALTKPVNGITPSPRPATTAEPRPVSVAQTTVTPPAPSAAPKPKAPPAPTWLTDANRAAQYLTTLTHDSSAEAALLSRGQDLIAFAGKSDKAEAGELARLAAASWVKDGNPSGAQVRFIRLASGRDYVVYSTLAAEDIVLSMAFQAETPLGQIRKQARRAIAAMFETANAGTVSETAPSVLEDTQPILAVHAEAPTGSSQALTLPIIEPVAVETAAPIEELTAELPAADASPEPQTESETQTGSTSEPPINFDNIDWAAFPVTEPTHVPPTFDWLPLSQQTPNTAPVNSLAKDNIAPIDSALLFTPDAPPTDLDFQDIDPSTLLFAPTGPEVNLNEFVVADDANADLDPIPDAASLNELSNALLQLERQALIEQPPLLDLPPLELPSLRRTPHSLYDLTYTFLLIPRLPTNLLNGDLRSRLEQWLITLADVYDWEADSIVIEPGHIELRLRAAPSDSPDYIARTLQVETSDRILNEFPRLAAEHAKRPGAFWSPGYFVTTPGRPLSHDEVTIFIDYQRREQSGGKY
jgi:REP element-mobilizing transposase RayT/CheY-like chemotaxis protein